MVLIHTTPEKDTERLRGRERRSHNLSTKLTVAEESAIEQVASHAGKTPSEWAREVLLREAKLSGDSISTETLMTEIVGLQLFLTHALQPVACGEQMSPGQYEELMRQVKASKYQAAREVVAQQIANKKEPTHD